MRLNLTLRKQRAESVVLKSLIHLERTQATKWRSKVSMKMYRFLSRRHIHKIAKNHSPKFQLLLKQVSFQKLSSSNNNKLLERQSQSIFKRMSICNQKTCKKSWAVLTRGLLTTKCSLKNYKRYLQSSSLILR